MNYFINKEVRYYEPVKHKVGMMCSFGDVSITPEGCVCRHCGGKDYTVDCVICDNAFSSSEVSCPYCLRRKQTQMLGKTGGEKSAESRFKGMTKEQKSEVMRRVRLPGKKEQRDINTAQKKVINEI